MDWDKLKVFHAAAAAGSFTHAGEQLGLSQSAVSRQVSALEGELGVSLFHRHARGLILTEQGELLHHTAHEVFMKLEAARAKLTDTRERPNGELRVTTTPGIGVHWLTPRLAEFLDLYPDIRVTLITTEEELDLAMREADVAITLNAPTCWDVAGGHALLLGAGGDLFAANGDPVKSDQRGNMPARHPSTSSGSARRAPWKSWASIASSCWAG